MKDKILKIKSSEGWDCRGCPNFKPFWLHMTTHEHEGQKARFWYHFAAVCRIFGMFGIMTTKRLERCHDVVHFYNHSKGLPRKSKKKFRKDAVKHCKEQ